MFFNLSKTFYSLLFAPLFSLLTFTAVAQTPSPTPVEDDKPELVFIEEIKLNVSAFDDNGNLLWIVVGLGHSVSTYLVHE